MSQEQNKVIGRRFVEEHNRAGYEAILEEYTAPEVIYHDPVVPALAPGREALKQFIAGFRLAMPDIKDVAEDVIAEEDRVAVRWTGTATHTGELMGIPATGKVVNVTGIYILQLQEGKVLEIWNNWDTFGFLQQLGVAFAPGQ